jgi:hypothetical protein
MCCVQFEYQRGFGRSNPALVDRAVRSFIAIGRSVVEIVPVGPELKGKLTHRAGDDMTAGGR